MNISGVDLNLLLVFDALLTDGSVTRAAKRVGLSQPAFSNALGRLRAAVGDPLFQRTGRGMAPTPRALAMAFPVRAALDHLQRALSPPTDLPASSRIVIVAANQYAQCLLLPNAVRALTRRAPGVRLDVRDVAGPSTAVPSDVDLRLAWGSASHTHSDSVAILSDELVGIARRANRAVGRATNAAALRRLPRVLAHDEASPVDSEAGPGSHMMSDTLSAMCVVSRTDAIAVAPRRLVKRFATALGLAIFQLPDSLPAVALHLVSRRAMISDATIAAVKSCLIDAGHQLARGRR